MIDSGGRAPLHYEICATCGRKITQHRSGISEGKWGHVGNARNHEAILRQDAPTPHPVPRAEAERRVVDVNTPGMHWESDVDSFVAGAEWMRAALLTERPAPTPEPRHFAPYGSTNALCDETVPRRVAWDETTGEYANQRFTVKRDRTTCSDCLRRMGGGPARIADERERLLDVLVTGTRWDAIRRMNAADLADALIAAGVTFR